MDQVIEFLYRLEKSTISILTRLTKVRFWLLGTTLILCFYVYITAFPPFDLFDVKVWELTVLRGLNPFSPLPEHFVNNHTDKFAFRFTGPLLGSILRLDPYGYLVFHQLIAFSLVAAILNYGLRITTDKLVSTVFALGFCSLFMGKWGFYDMYSHFDALALLFLVLSLTTRHVWLILITLLSSYFTDERALIASCLIFLIFRIRESNFNCKFQTFFRLSKMSTIVIVSWSIYFIIRYTLAQYLELRTSTQSIGLDVLLSNYKFMPMALLFGLEGFWVLVITSLIIIYTQSQHFLLTLFLSGVVLVFTVSLLVYDVSRSTAYLLPACLMAFEICNRNLKNRSSFLRLILVCSTSSVVIPTVEFFNQVYWLGPIIPKIFKWI